MGNGQKLGLAVGAMVLGLGLGTLVFRPTLPPSRPSSREMLAATATPSAKLSFAPAAAKPVGPSAAQLAAARAARDAESDREARIDEIDQQIRDLPEADSTAAPALANEIKLRRAQVEELRARVAELDQTLAYAGAAPEPGVDSQSQLQLEASVAELQRQLTFAEESVSEQKRQIGWIAASNDDNFMSSLYNELARRANIVTGIQQEIRDLFGARQSDLEAEEARRRGNVESLRRDRNALAEAYNEAVAGLSDAHQRYQQLLAEINTSRHNARALSTEKTSLLQR